MGGVALPALLVGRLLEGEALLWSDRPAQGLRLVGRDALLIPFSLLWGGFAVFWEAGVLRTNAPGFMALFGIPFVAVGLFLIVGRFPTDAWLRARTLYALTDRRVLILRDAPWGVVTALPLDRLPEVALVPEAQGRGTIRFGPQTPLWGGGRNGGFSSWVAALDPTPQFLAVADAQTVFDTIQRLSAGGASRSAPAPCPQ